MTTARAETHGRNHHGREDIRTARIRLIHVGKRELGLSRDLYEELLAGATGKRSCSDMNLFELNQVLTAMKKIGFTPRKAPPQPSDEGRLSPRQLYYIRGLWALASRAGNEKSLRAMVKRIAGVDDLRFVPREKGSALILALRDIARKAGFDPDGRQ